MTAFPGTVLLDLAACLTDVLTAGVPGVKVYGYEPRDLDVLPALTVGGMDVERTTPGEQESEIGAVDWDVTTRVQIYETCDDPETAFNQIRRLVPMVISVIDGNGPSPLLDLALDTKVVSSTIGFTEQADAGRQLVVGTLQVRSLILVEDT